MSNKLGTNSPIPSKSSTPANDSFANLVSFHATQPAKTLSLQERQRSLQEQRVKEEQERQKQLDTHFGFQKFNVSNHGDGSSTSVEFANTLPGDARIDQTRVQKPYKGVNNPSAIIGQKLVSRASTKSSESEDDLLAAFGAAAPVDSSTHFPVPTGKQKDDSADYAPSSSRNLVYEGSSMAKGGSTEDLDNDPFGLGISAPSKKSPPVVTRPENKDDDVLGLLGRPVSEVHPHHNHHQSSAVPTSVEYIDPRDKAIAELVDMGFSADRSSVALQNTESGLDVQAAVGWLLHQAHEESRQKPRVKAPLRQNSGERKDRQPRQRISRTNSLEKNGTVPTWMREQSRPSSTHRRENSSSPACGERDPAKLAAELGNNLFKSANSLWKTGTKKLNQAVSEFNSDSDSSQPKWMREGQRKGGQARASEPHQIAESMDHENRSTTVKHTGGPIKATLGITDEALLLESRDAQPRGHQRSQSPKRDTRPSHEIQPSYNKSSGRLEQSGTVNSSYLHSRDSTSVTDSRMKPSRLAVEDHTSQAYISPARRKKAVPNTTSSKTDIISNELQKSLPSTQPRSEPIPKPLSQATRPLSRQPAPVTRRIPQFSSTLLQASKSHRQAGTAAFKLGNYAQATTSYTSSLSTLPETHPLTIVILTNRALTHLRTGDPRACILDSDAALALIGPSKGQSESIDMGSDEGTKDMASFWGKAMTRRAEGLEQLERWNDAAKTWKECVEAGVGGNTSIQGRNRCEKASGGDRISIGPAIQKTPVTVNKPLRRPAPKVSTATNLSARTPASMASSDEAVTRLRAANAQAERVDDEKFALSDSVDARLSKWRNGKEGNLRALLGSLDTVLWEGSGWKKVGLSELVIPAKVKVAYMKGIAKVHPDKVCEFLQVTCKYYTHRWKYSYLRRPQQSKL